MVEFKPGMKKEELLAIAAANGITADDSMTKAEIIDALNAHNAQEAAEKPTERATEGAGSAEDGEGGGDTTHGESGGEQTGEGKEGNDGSGNDGGGGEQTGEEATEGEEDGGNGGGDNDAPGGGKPAEQPAEGYDTFVYCGPSIPRGRLKENAVFRGTLADVLNYLADVVEDYPQIPRLIVPTNRLAVFAVKVKTPGNIAHKYYSDIASAIRKGKEV